MVRLDYSSSEPLPNNLSTEALRRVNHLQIRSGVSENTAQVEAGNDDRVSPRVLRAIGQFGPQPAEEPRIPRCPDGSEDTILVLLTVRLGGLLGLVQRRQIESPETFRIGN
ncbi:MAG: hypothetical protein MOB07_24105 [Acidobacteria bacterium]|nr:hypothetical protein [Acidobacteriota bacterium]